MPVTVTPAANEPGKADATSCQLLLCPKDQVYSAPLKTVLAGSRKCPWTIPYPSLSCQVLCSIRRFSWPSWPRLLVNLASRVPAWPAPGHSTSVTVVRCPSPAQWHRVTYLRSVTRPVPVTSDRPVPSTRDSARSQDPARTSNPASTRERMQLNRRSRWAIV
jgi:hypothetical protein